MYSMILLALRMKVHKRPSLFSGEPVLDAVKKSAVFLFLVEPCTELPV